MIDSLEAFLARAFLRQYVTYCARRGKYSAMQGAAALAMMTDANRPD